VPTPTLRSRAVVALVLGMSLLPSCGPKPPVPVVTGSDGRPVNQPGVPKADEEALAAGIAADATTLAARGDKAGARDKEDQLLASYPSTAAAARLFEQRGNEAEKAGNVNVAIANFEKLLFYRPSFAGIDALRERYAELLLDVNRFADAANMLRALFDSATSGGEKLRLSGPLAVALVNSGRADEALGALATVLSRGDLSAGARDGALAQALDIIDGSLSFKEAEGTWDKVRGNSDWAPLHAALAFKLAKIYYHVRDFKRSEQLLELIATKYSASALAAPARDFALRLRSRFQIDALAIGVILPLSGKYEQYGTRSLIAIKLAFATDNAFRLVVKDTQGDSTTAAQAVEDLVMKDHVIAIIGPLFSNEAQSAAQKAEELSVPLVALSFKDGLPQMGPFVFRTALTVASQAKELARIAFERLGMSRFALLYPRNTYGMEFTRAFWDEVDRRHGEVRGAESYEIDQTTFIEPIKKLVGRYFLNARTDFKDALLELKLKKLPPLKFESELEKISKRMGPLVDFDAIVIPDSSKNIGLIAPALAFEDIVVTHDPKELEKIKKATGHAEIRPVTLLGASTWNTPQTIENCARDCEGAVFVDAYYPDSPEPRVRDFVAAFRDSAGIEPHLSEAQAYDTAGLVRWIIAEKRPADREALLAALTSGFSYEGVTGRTQFDADGEAQKELFVLTIQQGQIRRIELLPGPPQG